MQDIVIIGSGPAGWTAAIYAARADLKPIVVASSVEIGGDLMNTTEVENFPGFPQGVLGPELMASMQAQAERFGATTFYDDVAGLDLEGETKTVHLGSGESIQAKTVVVATGSAYRKLGLHDEERGWGRAGETERVSAELTAYGVGWPWFTLGDLDLGTHIARTALLREGLPLSAVTERLSLGTGITLVAQHDRIVLAKQVATVDHLSGGRFTLGVGFGWNREEAEDHGVDWARRREIVRDKIALMHALWAPEPTGHRGPYASVQPSLAHPKPYGRARPRTLIGGKAGVDAVQSADLLLMLGTDYPYVDFLPKHGNVIQIDERAFALGRRTPLALGVVADVREFAALLAPEIGEGRSRTFLEKARENFQASRSRTSRPPVQEARENTWTGGFRRSLSFRAASSSNTFSQACCRRCALSFQTMTVRTSHARASAATERTTLSQ